MSEPTIGIDVSKDHLDAYRLIDGARRRFANDRTGLRALRKWLEEQPPERIVYEPTGPYHRLLEHTLLRAGRHRHINLMGWREAFAWGMVVG